MGNTFKPYAGLATKYIKNKPFRIARIKLTLITTLIVMFIIVVFSFVTYIYVENKLARGSTTYVETDDHKEGSKNIEERIESDTLNSLKETLIFLNGAGFILIAGASYLLARKSLKPLENELEKQKQFLNDVAHEIRTPLAVLQAANESVSGKGIKISEYQEVVSDTKIEIAYLNDMVNSLLELARQETLKENTSPQEKVDLSSLLKNQIEIFTPYSKKSKVKLEFIGQSNVLVKISVHDFRTLAGNIIKNAIDFSPNSGTVKIDSNIRNGKPYFSVEDNGIGIPKSQITKVTQRFYKTDRSRSNESTGTGLGLALVKELSEKYNAVLEIESEEGNGTKVSVTFDSK